jgi:hypothetical protein
MSTTAFARSLDDNDTLSPSVMTPSDYFPMAEVPEYALSSDTLPIDTEGDQPRVPVVDRKERPYYLPEISWEGMVLKVNDDSFVARLTNLNDHSEQEEAEILNEYVSDQDDLRLIAPGAIFFWSIARCVKGRRSDQYSTILFRRLPVWSKHELANAFREAANLKKELGW